MQPWVTYATAKSWAGIGTEAAGLQSLRLTTCFPVTEEPFGMGPLRWLRPV